MAILRQTLAEDSLFYIKDGEKLAYGCNQAWFPTPWSRGSGCGPAAASDIFYYISCTDAQGQGLSPFRRGDAPVDRRQFAAYMRKVWKCVTPGIHGINSTGLLADGMALFAARAGVPLDIFTLDVDTEHHVMTRDFYQKCADFILAGLADQAPVAFLNLDNGQVRNLSRWHWVVITGVAYETDLSTFTLCVTDEGKKRDIDFRQWLYTTFGGGGLLRVKTGGR